MLRGNFRHTISWAWLQVAVLQALIASCTTPVHWQRRFCPSLAASVRSLQQL